ncbi:MAG TPA: hypothetical protein VF143_11680 [Candidatus Nanopelagicales bacterium]
MLHTLLSTLRAMRARRRLDVLDTLAEVDSLRSDDHLSRAS